MKETTKKILEEMLEKYPSLHTCHADIQRSFDLLSACFSRGGRLFVCGNGGSAADCEHIVGELLKCFKKRRPIDDTIRARLQTLGEDGAYLCEKLEGALPAYSLISQMGVLTAFANDKAWDAAFAQETYALGRQGDCLLCLSTSGNSKNCVYAAIVAKAKGMSVLSMTGAGGGKLGQVSDCTIAVPETETYKVQELHLPVYHCLCAMLEEEFF